VVTKCVSLEPRTGAPAPRVGEFAGGMINAVGLANPGLAAVRRDHLPWLAESLRATQVLVNVVGFSVDEFARVIEGLDGEPGIDAYELNVSCPNVKAGGMEFGADPAALRAVVAGARAVTRRPLFVKLSPALASVADAARTAVDAGADALTLVNTMPGLVVDVERRRPVLGFGSGGVSGEALLPIGVLATWRVHRAGLGVPILGLGGVRTAGDALQYLMAGARLVGIGTASMQDPRLPERVVRDLERWCARHGVTRVTDVVGTLQWPA
jgi:dihydroorotate dehydrogenase (NAD+) catalytic subunit